ncbi:hypothetical protein MMC30_008640 [Trapelia coarctata]|nr:hypothetical protein [Trapelia coarctata]
MVGRTSKRNKRARLDADKDRPASPTVATQDASQVERRGSSAPDPPVSPEPSLPPWSTACSPGAMDFLFNPDSMHDLFPEGCRPNASTSEATIEPIDPQHLSFNSQLLDIDLNIDHFDLPVSDGQDGVSHPHPGTDESTAAVYTTTYTLTPPATAPETLPQNLLPGSSRRKPQYPHVAALSQIIALLEAHIQYKDVAIDEIMRVNKASIADTTKIMNCEEYKMCKSCVILASTVMELVVTLYEYGVSSKGEKAADRNLLSKKTQNKPPNVQFGVFQFDPEEQLAFRNHIICKELQRSTKVIQTLSAQRQSITGDGLHNIGRVHKQWYMEMEHRIKALVTSLSGW